MNTTTNILNRSCEIKKNKTGLEISNPLFLYRNQFRAFSSQQFLSYVTQG